MPSIQEQIFHERQADWLQLAAYGFKGAGTDWTYTATLVNNLRLTVTIHDADITTSVNDADSGAPYVLHLNPANAGTFVGEVRTVYEAALTDIADKCFKRSTFASGQSAAIIAQLTADYGETPEFLWQKFPNNAIIRRADNRKWYTLLVKVTADRVGLPGSDILDILTVRANPEMIDAQLKSGAALPAYHMNKQHWLSYRLDDQSTMSDLLTAIENSRQLAH